MSDISWIKTKAGLQMAETINRYLPRILVCLEELAKMDDDGINVDNNKREIISDIRRQFNRTYGGDILKLIDEMDVRKQENINLKHQIDRLETIIEERK